ncbi:uncharacterized protein LOC118766833 isoform X2 [Octopus sinensis]|uniref:Uncharacterized protein LOC118766833 isoform X2 n=1 Tax=Octopus sinensis TaxID=2607531 RepID=A0A7E6FGS4_9MOLL|nr:uncharacterized protein LOC118766833 isoform X2 [Octopus sinensis]
MMSRGYINVGEGSWRSLGLPAKLLLSMMMIAMMYSYTSAEVEITLSPAHGFAIGDSTEMQISCHFNATDFHSFSLHQNGTVVSKMEHDNHTGKYIVTNAKDFYCSNPKTKWGHSMVDCWKRNLNCHDATSYRCSVNDTHVSSPASLKVKSSLHSLEHVHNHDAAMKHVDVFNCTAHVALPSQNEVVFHWKVMHGFQMTSEKWDKVNVWGSDTCYANVTSSYHHHLGHDHSANPTTIACTVFQETRTKVVNQPHMGFPSAASGMLYTKWILVVNLILLFLVAAISR